MVTKKAGKATKKPAKKGAKKQPKTGFICVRGTLTDEGVECQALRGDDGQLYTLLGDLQGHKIGEEVIVCGNVVQISFCMQGTTISISWIGNEAARASR